MNEQVLDSFTKDALESARASNTYRTLRHIVSPEASHVKIACNGSGHAPTDTLLLASNSYLDLSNIDELKRSMADAVLKWGTGSGGARLTTGNKTPHDELEECIAQFKGEEAAITFNTGYMANVGTISALCGKNDFVFSDELNHASIIDGIRLSRASCKVYRHNDIADLERAIAEAKQEAKQDARPFRGLIVTDAVFSMDGDLANMPELLRVAREQDVLLMIDEAHATGVVGKTGRGLAEHYGCAHADVTVGTLSKAVAAEGGFVAGSRQLIDFLRNKARSFIFTTAMAPAVAAAACNNLRYIGSHPERVRQLQDNVKFFCEALKREGLGVQPSPSAIVPIVVGDEARALEVSATLQERGIHIPAIRYPTVARGQARLRASLMATHTQEELQTAATAISQIIKSID
ncbi:8-amino-7-oxononanoate synthase [Fibrobacter sp.]|uniref:aminotransferase class I/II-fold pyridoxal phosphate-dependent enzyme n=1 Tax=Fibrobacter sp. TaxID=35828 RepID=UPI0025C4863E|nr:8-amino-7-oxononanoate synthase [Fibrobacter sp.]MBR4007702.1 8-amino-7-oxononanoate synthase [Fibrobacter sp.]